MICATCSALFFEKRLHPNCTLRAHHQVLDEELHHSLRVHARVPDVWPHLNLAELYSIWFLFVTPITTLIAFIVLIRRRWMGPSSIPAWFLVIASFVVNALVLLGLYAAFAF